MAEEEIPQEDSRAAVGLHEQWPGERVERLLEEGRQGQWRPDDLFRELELHERPQCQDFSDRAFLEERHQRWREAVWLLAALDKEALYRWIFGGANPPRIAQEEVEHQLRCMIGGLVFASRIESYRIRLFLSIGGQFGGSVASVTDLASRIEANPRWLDRTVNALNRSLFRDMGTQGFIWYRKFMFQGRSFNLVSPEAGEQCGIQAGQTWKPDHPTHQRCWSRVLSPEEREREILIASAAPGLSRHHWGTDVDILGLNPHHFIEGGALYDDWRWLDRYGLDYGFFQPYRGNPDLLPAHFEERWHWSYFPIAQSLWEFIYQNQGLFEAELFQRWDRLERRWGRGRGPFFDYMRDHWRAYLFHIDRPVLEQVREVREL